jgi:hypothetical protein
MIEAAVQREERQTRLLATMTANLMNCWLKRPVTGNQLLGIKEAAGDGYADRDDGGKAAMLDRIAKKLERVHAKKARAKKK